MKIIWGKHFKIGMIVVTKYIRYKYQISGETSQKDYNNYKEFLT